MNLRPTTRKRQAICSETAKTEKKGHRKLRFWQTVELDGRLNGNSRRQLELYQSNIRRENLPRIPRWYLPTENLSHNSEKSGRSSALSR